MDSDEDSRSGSIASDSDESAEKSATSCRNSPISPSASPPSSNDRQSRSSLSPVAQEDQNSGVRSPESSRGISSPGGAADTLLVNHPKSPQVHEDYSGSPLSRSPLSLEGCDNKRSIRHLGSSNSSSRASTPTFERIPQQLYNDDSSGSETNSRKHKNVTGADTATTDTQPEEISDGDIDSDHDNSTTTPVDATSSVAVTSNKKELTITHEDLSDVSDLDDSIGGQSDENLTKEAPPPPAAEVAEATTITTNTTNEPQTKNDKSSDITESEAVKQQATDEAEEQLDFEAEDGECDEPPALKEKVNSVKETATEAGEITEQRNGKEQRELEEGEVSDEDEARPEETEPRPICRFFSKGQCTWGASCRFLHPGVTDKGNYTMFDMVRPMVPGEFPRDERHFMNRVEPPPPRVESAWERGLRTAKEMLRKSIKRKEQDIDFEEKKMNLSLAQDELDKDNGYYGHPEPRPPPVVVGGNSSRGYMPADAFPPMGRPTGPPPPHDDYYGGGGGGGRRQVIYESEYPLREQQPPRTRTSYRELPAHRMPDYYNNKYEDEQIAPSKPKKVKREVIVQRTEERVHPVGVHHRGDEWSDPWMRSKSPGARGGGSSGGKIPAMPSRKSRPSYSSRSSYSSSSSSPSSSESSKSSTERSRSRSQHAIRRPPVRRPVVGGRHHVSPSIIVSERKAANERAALMNPPAPRKRAASPSMLRVSGANPSPPPPLPPPPAPSQRLPPPHSSAKDDHFGKTRSKLAVAAALARQAATKNRGRPSKNKTSSDSSGSSSSDSDSSGSSSSTSRDGSSTPKRGAAFVAKAIDALKNNSSEKRHMKFTLKNPSKKTNSGDIPDLLSGRKADSFSITQQQGKKRSSNSIQSSSASTAPPPSSSETKSKKSMSRREELLKQLKAVEDAIAKKRSKVN